MLYRKESNRLPERDYRNEWWYFITICIKNFKCLFGVITEWDIVLSEIGKIVEEEILNTEKLRNNIEIWQYVIMPNHLHMVVFINDTRRDSLQPYKLDAYNASLRDTKNVLNYSRDGLQPSKLDAHNESLCDTKNVFWPQKNNLWTIIRGLKWAITSRIIKINPSFSWQSNYYEHVVRDDKDLERIQNYIINNPIKRKNDEYYR